MRARGGRGAASSARESQEAYRVLEEEVDLLEGQDVKVNQETQQQACEEHGARSPE